MLKNSLTLISKKFIGTTASQCNRMRCMSSGANRLVGVDVNDKTGIASK